MNGQPETKPDPQLPLPPPAVKRKPAPQEAQSLGTPMDFRRGGAPQDGQSAGAEPEPAATDPTSAPTPRKQATETIAQRAGALSDEIDFVDFVAGLVHGTFDAIVDASIRQMESYADLVSAVAKQSISLRKTMSRSTRRVTGSFRNTRRMFISTLAARRACCPNRSPAKTMTRLLPGWLNEFQLDGQELTPELLEDTIVPRARLKVGQSRQQTLATLVLLGLNRVVVRDGTISARLRFRASAADKAKVEYAVSDDPGGGGSWGGRASSSQLPTTKVSTLGVNVQSDAELKAELFGEVKINFASETLPLERFADEARRTLLERRAKPSPAPAAVTTAPATPAPESPAPVSPAPAPPPAAPAAPAAPVVQQPPAPSTTPANNAAKA